MKERGILFSAPMVRALLEGRKTQTRRIVKHKGSVPPVWATHCNAIKMLNIRQEWDPANLFQWSEDQPAEDPGGALRRWPSGYTDSDHTGDNYAIPCPHGKPGDRLWVRETWAAHMGWDDIKPSELSHDSDSNFWWAADRKGREGSAGIPEARRGKWRPSIFMPRWASRITLEITDVRVERLQDISEEDAIAEGIVDGGCVNCGNPEPCRCAEPSPDARDSFVFLWESINGAGSWGINPWVWAVSFKAVAHA